MIEDMIMIDHKEDNMIITEEIIKETEEVDNNKEAKINNKNQIAFMLEI
jgi:hypothetical protein